MWEGKASEIRVNVGGGQSGAAASAPGGGRECICGGTHPTADGQALQGQGQVRQD